MLIEKSEQHDAAGDVMWLEDIKEKQDIELNKQNLHRAVQFECEFLKSLAYFKHCGVHLDTAKWKAKMEKDLARLKAAEEALNNWVINWVESQSANEHSQSLRVKYCTELSGTPLDPVIPSNGTWLRKEVTPNGDVWVEYEVPVTIAKFVYRNLQGSLFEGFDIGLKCNINWSSSQQVIQLFELLGVHVKTFDKKTKKEKKSIEEKQISPQKDHFSIIPLFLEYQKASKVVSTYGQNWLDAVNKNTGRIHPDYYSIGTDTSRVSSGGGISAVNIQNIPHDAETRSCFTATNGNKWISCDYSGQESCITASVSRDTRMCEILNTGGDLHSEVAKACWPDLLGHLTDKEVKEQYKEYRQNAKGVEFGIN